MQDWIPSVPAQIFNVAPFPLMIFALLAVSLLQRKPFHHWQEKSPLTATILRCFTGSPPTGLGKTYQLDQSDFR